MSKRKSSEAKIIAAMKWPSNGINYDAETLEHKGIKSPRKEDMYAIANLKGTQTEKWFRTPETLEKWKLNIIDTENWKVTINQNHHHEN